MSKIEENKRRDFLEEVLMLAKFYELTREDVIEIFGTPKKGKKRGCGLEFIISICDTEEDFTKIKEEMFEEVLLENGISTEDNNAWVAGRCNILEDSRKKCLQVDNEVKLSWTERFCEGGFFSIEFTKH